MPAIKSINQTLKEISELGDTKKITEELKKHAGNIAIRTILKYVFDPDIKFLLPEGMPPIKEIPIEADGAALYREIRKLYLFIAPHPQIKTVDINKIKRETLFIDLLESIAKDDRELLVAIKDGNFPYKTINKKIVKKVMPEIF